jgi:hypothetical protein
MLCGMRTKLPITDGDHGTQPEFVCKWYSIGNLIPLIFGQLNCYHWLFFWKHRRTALHYILIKKKKGERDPIQHHTSLKVFTNAPVEQWKATKAGLLLGYNYWEGQSRRIAPKPLPKPTTDTPPLQNPKHQPSWEQLHQKTQLLRWFHRVQAPRITRELNLSLLA